MNRIVLFLISLLFVVTTQAQLTERIETDRPDQTETPFTTPHKWFQSETGFNIENYKGTAKTYVHPTMLNKYGISQRFEIRLITEFVSIQTPLPADGLQTTTGLLPLQVGGKLALFEEKGLLPKTSLIFHAGIPKAATSEFQTPNWSPNFRFTMQHTLSYLVSLGYHLGAGWDGAEKNQGSFIYTIAPGFNLSKKWYAYIEAFGFLGNGDPQHGVDGGIAYNFSNNTKIDFSGGFGVTDKTALRNYIALGFSFRLPLKK